MAAITSTIPVYHTVDIPWDDPMENQNAASQICYYDGSTNASRVDVGTRFLWSGVASNRYIFAANYVFRTGAALGGGDGEMYVYWVDNEQANVIYNNTRQWMTNGSDSGYDENNIWTGIASQNTTYTKAISASTARSFVDNDYDYWIIHKISAAANRGWIIYGNASASEPYISYSFGYKIPTLSASSGLRTVTLSWASSSGASSYNIYRGASLVGSTASTSYAMSDLSYDSYTYVVKPVYNLGTVEGNDTVVAAPSNPASYVPSTAISAVGDTPIRKRVRITKPAGAVGSPDSFDYDIRTTANVSINGLTNQTTATSDINLEAYAPGTYRVHFKSKWSDGEATNWSSTYATVTITQPILTGLTATTTLNRRIDLSWTRLSDAASYDVKVDGVLYSNVTNPASGAVTEVIEPIGSGTHSIIVTPIYTNGYTGNVTSGAIEGAATVPTPTAPTIVGDSPSKRNIRATAPSLPSAFHDADEWEFRRDSSDSTIIIESDAVGDFLAVPKGTHTVEVRAVWNTEADISAWSPVSNTVSTTSPPPTSVASRHRSAPSAVATTGVLVGGGTIPAGSYYIAVSVNKGGSRTTETVNLVSRSINESSPSPLQDDPVVIAANGRVTVDKPSNCTGSDTWNVYMGTNRNVLTRVKENLATGTASSTVTAYTAGAHQARTGEVDLQWVAPTGVGDAPVGYKVERAASSPANSPTGTASGYLDISNSQQGDFYGSNLKFYNDQVDTKYWFYKVSAVYSNDSSDPVEMVVGA